MNVFWQINMVSAVSPGCWAMHLYTWFIHTEYPKKYQHGFCFAVLCCGYTLTVFPISTRLTSMALWQSSDCPSASKATLMNMDKYFMWIHYERLHNHNKAKHNKTVCIFLGIHCSSEICFRVPTETIYKSGYGTVWKVWPCKQSEYHCSLGAEQ